MALKDEVLLRTYRVLDHVPGIQPWVQKRRRRLWIRRLAPDPDEVFRLWDRPCPKVGDAAPDFTLPLVGKSETVSLSEWTAEQPLVLIFGSYT